MEEKLLNAKSNYLTAEYLSSLYQNLKMPRNKIANLVKKKELIHIKRGLYIHGKVYGRQYSKAVLSGIIYGPSAISFQYALSHHGLIPERVESITCICFKKDKDFRTDIGHFKYKYMAKELYPVDLKLHETKLGNFFMASPEKALCDIAYFEKIDSIDSAKIYLYESLRIDKDGLSRLSIDKLRLLATSYKRRSVKFIADAIEELI